MCPLANIGEPSGRLRGMATRMVPRPSLARSAPVKTPRTPGAPCAALSSIDRITACACGERTMTAYAWPGWLMSSTKRPLPRNRRGSSKRDTDCPMPYLAIVGVPFPDGRCRPRTIHCSRLLIHRSAFRASGERALEGLVAVSIAQGSASWRMSRTGGDTDSESRLRSCRSPRAVLPPPRTAPPL